MIGKEMTHEDIKAFHDDQEVDYIAVNDSYKMALEE